MKQMKFTALLLAAALMLGSCGTMNYTAKGGAIGAGSGTAAGAIIGGLIGKGKGAAIGAAVGAAVGAGTGVIIGRKMDQKAAKAAEIEGAQVEQVTDTNGLPAVKVSFADGILFDFNSTTLSNESKARLRELAEILRGHTDKAGTYEVNMKFSKNRAYAVENYLQDCGVSPAQFKQVTGVGYNEYDESLTAAENRRVDIYMYASEEMIQQAEAQN